VSSSEQVDKGPPETAIKVLGTVTVSGTKSPNIAEECTHIPCRGRKEIVLVSAKESTHTSLQGTGEITTVSTSSPSSASSAASSVEYTHSHGGDKNDMASALRQLSDLSIATAKAMESSLGTCSPVLVEETRRSLQQSNQLVVSSCDQSSVSSKTVQISTTMDIKDDQRVAMKSDVPVTISFSSTLLRCDKQWWRTINMSSVLCKRVARQTYELFETGGLIATTRSDL
jgi:hypothetical protein